MQASGGRYELCRSYEQFVDLVTEYISQVDGRVLERLRQIHLEREEEEKQKIRKQYQKRISKTFTIIKKGNPNDKKLRRGKSLGAK